MRRERESITQLLVWPKAENATWLDFAGREEIDELIDIDPFEARDMALYYRDNEPDPYLRNRYQGLYLLALSRCVPTPPIVPMQRRR